MVRLVTIQVLFLITALSSKGQGFADRAVQKFMAEGKVPGLFIAVVKDDRVLYERSLGLADVVNKIPVTSKTCFELGSISKAFAADHVYELQSKGFLHLNDPVTRYFPDAPYTWSSIKIAHLLNHTSGIQNYLLDPRFHAAAYFTGEGNEQSEMFFAQLSTDTMIKMFYSLPLEFSPGSNWSYSNTAYILLGKIIEKVSGEKFFEQVEKKLAASLQMLQTKANETAAGQGCLAKGYLLNENGLKTSRVLTTNYAFSAGAWATSGADMIRYLKAIHQKRLPVDSTGFDWRGYPVFTNLPVSYQGGRFYTTFHGQKIIFHNGGTPGFSSSWIYVPKKNISIIILINRQDYSPVDRLAWDVLAHYEPVLKLPKKKVNSREAIRYTEVVMHFVDALNKATAFPEAFSKPLRTFLESENGNGLWRWIFERGFPTEAFCVEIENLGKWKAFRFRLPYKASFDYRLTMMVNEKGEVVQLLW